MLPAPPIQEHLPHLKTFVQGARGVSTQRHHNPQISHCPAAPTSDPRETRRTRSSDQTTCVKYKSPPLSLRRQRSSQLQCVLGSQTGKVLWLALPPEQCSKAFPIQKGYIVPYCSALKCLLSPQERCGETAATS